MDIFEATEIIGQYGGALAENKAYFQPVSDLPNSSPQLVIDAVKIYMAYMIKHPTLNKEQFEQLMITLMFLESFIPDELALKFNKIMNLQKKGRKIKAADLTFYNNILSESLKNKGKSHDSVVEYINALNQLDSNSPSYCKAAYDLANIPYKTEYEVDFQNEFFK